MSLEIGGRRVGPDADLFVVAELGLNHGGAPERALALVDAAARAGASAVKLQTLTPGGLVAPACPPPAHVRAASLADFFRTFELDEAAHRAVAARARQHGLAFVSTPLSLEAVDLLERVGADAYKIASGDLTCTPLLERVARTGRPMILSTGMSDLAEIADAIVCARTAGARQLALLHCISAYPVPAGGEQLRAIDTLAAAFDVPVGLSDHTTEPLAAALALALGASIYERHFVLDRNDGSVDAAVSSAPAELAATVRDVARVRRALGGGTKCCTAAEAGNRTASRRSLYASRDLRPGDLILESDIVPLRPGGGLAPSRWRELVGARVGRAVAAGTPFVEDDVAGADEARGMRDVA
ncbi:MAG TPA: N-acetylneuraminate synthase family protein [Vicinamibacterales bacterium]|nr:N-acetylneuraminate synthase family protein [Vicinamibacterales bacterium]